VDVSGLDVNEAADRLTQAYSVPVELHYGESSFQIKPSLLGFTLDLSSMMAAADQARSSLPFWSAFWDYLFNRLPASQEIPIRAEIDVKSHPDTTKTRNLTCLFQGTTILLPVNQALAWMSTDLLN
jgi:hypothetical protein